MQSHYHSRIWLVWTEDLNDQASAEVIGSEEIKLVFMEKDSTVSGACERLSWSPHRCLHEHELSDFWSQIRLSADFNCEMDTSGMKNEPGDWKNLWMMGRLLLLINRNHCYSFNQTNEFMHFVAMISVSKRLDCWMVDTRINDEGWEMINEMRWEVSHSHSQGWRWRSEVRKKKRLSWDAEK